MCLQDCGGPCVPQRDALAVLLSALSSLGRASIQPALEELGSSESLFQAGWGLQRPCPPPQGQWMGGRDVCLIPAPDASHSPALSSWFQLLHCLDEGSHAERVSGVAQQLSLSQGLALPVAHPEGVKMMWEAKPGLATCSPEVSGLRGGYRGAAGVHPSPRLAQVCGCPAARGSQVVAVRMGRCLRCEVVFSYVHSVQLPDPSTCLSLGLSPVFLAPHFLCSALLIPLCLVPTVLCRWGR